MSTDNLLKEPEITQALHLWFAGRTKEEIAQVFGVTPEIVWESIQQTLGVRKDTTDDDQ